MTVILPYLFIFLLLYLFSLEINGKNFNLSVNHKVISFLFCFIFCVFLGCRGCLDTDWNQYYNSYQKASNLSLTEFITATNFEYGFGVLIYVCNKINPNYFFFQFISFFIDFVIFYKFIIDFEKKIFSLSLLFFFIFEGVVIEVDLLRNSKSIMFFLYSTKFLGNKNYKYIMLNILGSLFHFSSLIYLFISPLLLIKLKKSYVVFFFVLGLFFFIFKIPVSSLALKTFLSMFRSGIIVEKTLFYINNDKYFSQIGFSIGFIERFCSFIIILYFQDRIIRANKRMNIFIILFYLYSFVYLYCWDVYILVLRFSKLFIISYWVVFPYMYICINKKNRIFFLLVFFIYAILRIYSDYAGQNLWEYNSIINLPDLQEQSSVVESFIEKSYELYK